MNEVRRRVEVLVTLWVDEDADISEVVQEMDYTFFHPAIRDTEITDLYTEI